MRPTKDSERLSLHESYSPQAKEQLHTTILSTSTGQPHSALGEVGVTVTTGQIFYCPGE